MLNTLKKLPATWYLFLLFWPQKIWGGLGGGNGFQMNECHWLSRIFWLKKLSDLFNYRGMSWAYDAAEEREIKNWHKVEKVNKKKTARVKRIFAEYFKKTTSIFFFFFFGWGGGGWVPNERMIIVYQLDIGIASKS